MNSRNGNNEPPRTSECGASAVEYSLLVALIAAVIIGTVGTFGIATVHLFESIPVPW